MLINVPSYYYNWKERETDNPSFPGGPPYIDPTKVRIHFDGNDVTDLAIFEMMTGPNGYINFYIKSFGKMLIKSSGELATCGLYGDVQIDWGEDIDCDNPILVEASR